MKSRTLLSALLVVGLLVGLTANAHALGFFGPMAGAQKACDPCAQKACDPCAQKGGKACDPCAQKACCKARGLRAHLGGPCCQKGGKACDPCAQKGGKDCAQKDCCQKGGKLGGLFGGHACQKGGKDCAQKDCCQKGGVQK